MKNSIFTLALSAILLIGITATLNAQYSEREIGINTSNLSSIGLDYKKKTGENKYFRFRASSGRINLSNTSTLNETTSDVDFNFSMGVGFEKRNYLNEKTFTIRGLAPSAGVTLDFNEGRSNNISYFAGLSYMLGIAYQFSDNFYAAVEINPGISVNISSNSDADITRVSTSAIFNQDFLNLSVVYQFNKQ